MTDNALWVRFYYVRYFLPIVLLIFGTASAIAAEPIGAQACGTCHIQEYEQWKQTPHALALARLTNTQQRNRGCRSCHTLAPQSKQAHLSGVQCESCHGLGEHYAPANVMKDKKLSALMGLKKISEATCMRCHTQDGPGLSKFDYETKKKLILHRPKAKHATGKKQ